MTAGRWLRYHSRHAVSTGGGLTADRQHFREELRLQAAQRFARGEGSTAIVRDLRVSVCSVQRWRHAWAEGGPRSLRSQGPASLPRLSDRQFAQLGQEAYRAWLGGPALDSEPREDVDRPTFPSDVHDPGCAETVGA